MSGIGQQLRDYWSAAGLTVPDGVPDLAIELFNRTHKCVFSADLVEYFTVVNGIDLDPDLITFWSLKEVRPVEHVLEGYWDIAKDLREPQDAKYFIFADYSMNSHLYAFSASPQPGRQPVYAIFDSEPILVADSFAEFVSLYLSKQLLQNTFHLYKP